MARVRTPGIEAYETSAGTRYVARWRDANGKPGKKRGFTSERAAARYRAKVVADIERGTYVDAAKSRVKVADFAAKWLGRAPEPDDDAPIKRESSWERDESIIRLHINPTIGNRPIGSITPGDVQDLVDRWKARYAKRTTRRHYQTLHAIFAAAVETENLARTPCRGIKLPPFIKVKRPVPEPADLHALAAAMPGYGPMVYLGGFLGMRWGEVAGLRVKRLDLLRGELVVSEQLTRTHRLARPKTEAGIRPIPLPPWLVEMLAEHLAAKGLTAADPDAFVFTHPRGGPLQYTRFRQTVWDPACVKVGLATFDPRRRPQYHGLTFHDLRRTAITAMATSGADLGTVKDLVGHTDIRTTDGYRQHSSVAARSAVDALGATFDPAALVRAREAVVGESAPTPRPRRAHDDPRGAK